MAVTVSCFPSRSSTICTGSSTRGRISSPTSWVSATGWPAIETMPVTRLHPGDQRRGLRLVGARGRVAGLGDGDDALRHRRHDGARLGGGHAVDGHHEGEQHDADEQVHEGAAHHDEHLLGHREPVEHAVLVAGPHLFQARRAGLVDELAEPAGARHPHRAGLVARPRGEHADHPDVAAERHRLDAVLGLAAAAGPQGGPEADHVLGHPHPEPLGRHEVADLVQRDRRGDTGGHEEHTEDEGERGHGVKGTSPRWWSRSVDVRRRRARAVRPPLRPGARPRPGPRRPPRARRPGWSRRPRGRRAPRRRGPRCRRCR